MTLKATVFTVLWTLGPTLALAQSTETTRDLRDVFEREVDRRLIVPEAVQQRYQLLADTALADKVLDTPQFLALVDRSEFVQAIMILTVTPDRKFRFIGASPVSTGKPGRFDYFTTPIGVFEHTLANPDFRAEGTRNELGIRGYGLMGMRVFDFGWQSAIRGWGRGGESQMRLQMHATDPDLLENRLGTVQSTGCIRIPATLNTFLDQYGILDAAYDPDPKAEKAAWVLRKDRMPTPWPGRWLVVVDSGTGSRPHWAVAPPVKKRPRDILRHE